MGINRTELYKPDTLLLLKYQHQSTGGV